MSPTRTDRGTGSLAGLRRCVVMHVGNRWGLARGRACWVAGQIGIGPPRSMGVRNGLSGQWASPGTGPGSTRSVSPLGGCGRTSGGLCVQSGSHKDDLDQELEVGVVLRDGEGLHRLGHLIVFPRRPTGIASVFSDVGLTTWRSRGHSSPGCSPLQSGSGSWRRSCRPGAPPASQYSTRSPQSDRGHLLTRQRQKSATTCCATVASKPEGHWVTAQSDT